MEPEKEEGNIEYKLKLTNKTSDRIEKLASQMAYRCNEGGSECIYILGVEDDGTTSGISEKEYQETLETLKKVADKNNYSVTLLSTNIVGENKNIYEVLVRELNDDTYIDIKVAVAGSVDAGKSSFLSVLTAGKLDDGRGSARLSIFNFPHEVKTGRTSSISHQILGFNGEGKVVNYRQIGKMPWPEIVKESSKIISFFDLAGHEKYLKTTILGLASSFPDICFIMVSANKGILRMTLEHIFLCISLNIPFVIVITKIDITKTRQNVMEDTMNTIKKLLKRPGVRRIPVINKNNDDVITCAKNVYTESIVPIFKISNVTGEGIDLVKYFLNILKKRNNPESSLNKVEYHIDSTFSISGVGTVTGGHLISGTVKIGDKLLLGPNDGKYTTVAVRSIHCKRVPVQSVKHGSYVCMGLKKVPRETIRRGSVMISQNGEQILTSTFTADISVLKAHSTTIKPGYEPVVHSGSIRQTAKLIRIFDKKNFRKNQGKNINEEDKILRTGDKAKVEFKFIFQPEYLKKGSRILLCEGRTKVIGVVL